MRKYPDRLAVKSRTDELSYQELDDVSNRVAHQVLSHREPGSEPVAVMLQQGATLIAAILGVLKASKMYVPLNDRHSAQQVRRILDDSGASLILADEATFPAVSAHTTARRLVLHILDRGSSPAAAKPDVDASPAALAYLFYTSGSTGTPKGVADNHRNVLHNIMRYTNNLGISYMDRLTLLQSSSFSGSVSSLFGALLNGASVHPLDLRQEGFDGLANRLRQERITIYHSVPAVFQHLAAEESRFPNLRVIRLEGDVTLPQHVELFLQSQGNKFSPDCVLVNGLRATETGLTRQFFIDSKSPLPINRVPIGYPTEDMEIELVDESGHPTPLRQIGEIVVRSRYLAVGYWNDERLTAAKFRNLDASGARSFATGDLGRLADDGCLHYLGRKDLQVKVRGEWVDLRAIEAALTRLDVVANAAVMTHNNGASGALITAYVVPANGEPNVSNDVLRPLLLAELPAALVPQRYVVLSALPLDDHGKVDRKSLPPPNLERPELTSEYVEPRDDLEKAIAASWQQALGLAAVGVNDNFFALGGDSLAATALLRKMDESLGVTISPAVFYEHPTVAGMAH